MTKGCLSSIKRLQQLLVVMDNSSIRWQRVVSSSLTSSVRRRLSFSIYLIIFSKSLRIFFEMPSTTRILDSHPNFFYDCSNYGIIILMQQQALLTIQNIIEQILEINPTTQLQKMTILQRLITKISGQAKTNQNLNFQIFQTEQYDIYHPSPEENIQVDNLAINNDNNRIPIISSFEINSTPTITECNMHNLGSELKGESVSSFMKYTKHEHKIKKRYIVDCLNTVRVCFSRLLQSIHKAYGHLTLWRYGKDTKYQIEVIYCRSIKAQVQYLKGQWSNSKGVESILSDLVDICQSIQQSLPQYERQFIKKNEEFTWPTSSQIFKVFKNQ